MKLGIVHVNQEKMSGPYTDLITANFNKVKNADTVLVHKYVKHLKRATDTVFIYPTLLNRVDVVECIVSAVQDGCDGVLVACSGDPGVEEGRTLVNVPVVGPMEAALHLACTYGHKVGIVTVADRSWKEFNEMMAVKYGIAGRLAGVRQIDVPSSEAFTRGFMEPKLVVDAIARQAKLLVEEGANSIVLGSAGMSVMASSAGLSRVPEYDAPIFDCLSVGLKVAELKMTLQQKLGVPEYSRVGLGERMSDKDTNRLRTLFELAASA